MLLLQPGKSQFIDQNGLPLVGGTVGFYSPGTLNPLPTYQDQAGTIANTNPISLDSRGQAIIWGSGVFRQIVKDVFGVTIWDQIVASADSAFTGANGASLIGFDSTNLANILTTRLNRVVDSIAALRALSKVTYTRAFVTGYYAPHDGGGGAYQYDPADTTTADNSGTVIVATDGGRWKLQQTAPLSVKQFGAKGDGATDDTVAFNAAFTGMGRGTLYVPPGTFITSGSITIGSFQYMECSGIDATIFSNTSLVNDVFLLPNPSSGISGCTITGSTSRTNGRFIYATNTQANIHDIVFLNWVTGIEINSSFQYLRNLRFVNACATTGAAIIVSNGGDQFIQNISLDTVIHPLAGIMVTGGGGLWLNNCDFIHAQNGVYVVASGSTGVSNLFFEQVACDNSSNNGWTFLTGGTATIIGVNFTDCWSATATNVGVSVTGSGGVISGFYCNGMRCFNNGADGFSFSGQVKDVSIVGGVSSGNAQSVGSTSGIHIGANINDISVIGMRIGPTEVFADLQNGITVDAGNGTRIMIANNNLFTARTPIVFNSTGGGNIIENNTGLNTQGTFTGVTDGAGHIIITHGAGILPKEVFVTGQNASPPIAMYPDTFTSTSFRVTCWNGTSLATGVTVTLSWRIGF